MVHEFVFGLHVVVLSARAADALPMSNVTSKAKTFIKASQPASTEAPCGVCTAHPASPNNPYVRPGVPDSPKIACEIAGSTL